MGRREEGEKEAAWRVALEQWLVRSRRITVCENPAVSPHFP